MATARKDQPSPQELMQQAEADQRSADNDIKPYGPGEFDRMDTANLRTVAATPLEQIRENFSETPDFDAMVRDRVQNTDMLSLGNNPGVLYNIREGWVELNPRSDEACKRDGVPSEIDQARAAYGPEYVHIVTHKQGGGQVHLRDCVRIQIHPELYAAYQRKEDSIREAFEADRMSNDPNGASRKDAEVRATFRPSEQSLVELLDAKRQDREEAERRGYRSPTAGMPLAAAMMQYGHLAEEQATAARLHGYHVIRENESQAAKAAQNAQRKPSFAMGAGFDKDGKLVRA